MFVLAFAIFALGDLFWSSIVSSAALVLVAALARQSAKRIAAIDRAVNGQGDDKPTMVSRIVAQDERSVEIANELAEFRKWQEETFEAFAQGTKVDIPEKVEPAAPVAIPVVSPPVTK